MTPCERYQAELLDHLYDLLEPAERTELEAHLAGCVPCQTALEGARRQQRLIAVAAKAKFEGVRFEKPTPAPATPILVMTTRSRLGWVRWAAAASVIAFLLGTLGVSGGVYWTEAARYHREIAQVEVQRNDLQRELNEALAPAQAKAQALESVRREQAELAQRQQQAVAETEKTIRGRQRYLSYTGPDTIEAGGANPTTIEVHDLATDQLVASKLSARLINDAGKEVVPSDQLALESERAGQYRLVFPRNLDVKQNQNLFLELTVNDDRPVKKTPDKDDATVLRTKLQVARPVYITHLTTDKPMYQPGEMVWFRSLTLERFSLKPADELLHLDYVITDANGGDVGLKLDGGTQFVDPQTSKPVLGPDGKLLRGVGAGSFPLPPGFAGGEYTLTVSERYGRFPPEKRKFIVNEYQKSALNMKLEFTQKSYGPGDEVIAACEVKPAGGGQPIARKPVAATVRIDGKTYGADGKPSDAGIRLQTDDAGAVGVRFRLPTQIDKGEASLAVQFTDGAASDTIVRTIPIVVKKFYVQLFPEGGDLVAGVPNRIYFQARTTLDKPAELKGRVVDEQARVAARLETLNDEKEPGANQGQGLFEFTPVAGRKYSLQIDTPAGVTADYEFPATKTSGIVLNIPKSVMTAKEPLRVRVSDTAGDRSLLVGVYCRGRLLAHQTIKSKAGAFVDVDLRPESGMGGVYRVTVFEETQAGRQFVPRAERLVYRAPAEKLNLSLRPQRQRFMPAEKALLSLDSLDETGKPAPAIVMLRVVDKTVESMADEKTARSMPTHFFLTTEVKKPEDVEFADFMLGEHPKAATALDLLLGTQGWRRFAEQDPVKFYKEHKEDAARMLATIGQTPVQASNKFDVDAVALLGVQQAQQKLAEEFGKQAALLQEQMLSAQQEYATANAAATAQTGELRGRWNHINMTLRGAMGQLEAYNREWRVAGLLAAGVALVLVGLVGVIVGLVRKGRAARPYFAAAACSVLLLALGLVYFSIQDVRSERLAQGPFRTHLASEKLADPESARLLPDQNGIPWGRPAVKDEPFDRLREGAEAKNGHWADKHVPPKPAEKMPDAAQLEGRPAPPPGAPGDPNRNLDHFAKDRARPAEGLPKGEKEVGAARELRDGDKPLGVELRKRAEQKLEPLEQARMRAGLRLEGDPRMKMPAGKPVPQPGMAGDKKDAKGAEALGRGGIDGTRRFMPLPAATGPVPSGAGSVAAPAAGYPRGPVGAAGAGGGRGAGFGGGPGMQPPGGGGFGYFAGEVPPPAQPLVVREYAHRHSSAFTGVRKDFTETLAWHPVLVLPDGRGRVEFELSDSITTFQALAFGHTLDGRLGVGKVEIESRLPFAVDPKVPIEVTASDKIAIPLSVTNGTEDKRTVDLTATAKGLVFTAPSRHQLVLDPNQKARRTLYVRPDLVEGEVELQIDGRADVFGDSVLKRFRVVPDGFPVNGSKSDVLEKVARNDVVLPESWIKGTLKMQVQVYPSTLADLQKGLEGLLREPNGCFEQTSTSNYPNVLILDYLRESEQVKPEVAQRARELLDRGYQKLTSFECLKPANQGRQGYEWFGGAAPPHEALTAYGLLQFRDMARVYNVDGQMVERTKTYLMSRRDGQGGFSRNARALDSFGRAPDDITNAYIVWALTESSKEDDLEKELNALKAQAKASTDPYFLALVANSVLNRGDDEFGAALLKKLAQNQKPDGHLDAEKTSITGSGGRQLQIETTALTLLAWLKANRPEFHANVQAAVKWIGQQRGGSGAFGSTQSTILALKALITHTKANKRPAEAGDLSLVVNGEPVEKLHFQAKAEEVLALELKNAERFLNPGKNDVRVELTGNSVFPYTLSWSYQTLKPASSEGCPVHLETKLSQTTAKENATVELTVSVKNVSGKGQGMTVAIVGLPAGLTLPEDMKQLKDFARLQDNDTKPGRISAWEIRGRELVLYWRDLAPNARIDVPLQLICRIPGEYRGPASRGYLYYNSDAKHWVEPLAIKIEAGE